MYFGIDGETLNVEMFACAKLQKKKQKQYFFLKKEKHLRVPEVKGEMIEETRAKGG